MSMRDDREAFGDGEIEVRGDFRRPECPLSWRLVGEEAWRSTPLQVADARHDAQEALKLVRGWLDAEAG